jgi:C4-type Zn-finger protein
VPPVTGASSQTDANSTVTGLLIIRLWLEPEHPATLRARITRSRNVEPDMDFETEEALAGATTVATTEEALEAVRAWLDGFVRR